MKTQWKFHGNKTGNNKNPTPRLSFKRKITWAYRVHVASHTSLAPRNILPSGVVCRCWHTLSNVLGRELYIYIYILMYNCSVYHTRNTIWNFKRTFSTQWSAQKYNQKCLVYLVHPVHELIMTAENQLAPVVSGCHKNCLVIDLSNLQAHLPLTPNSDTFALGGCHEKFCQIVLFHFSCSLNCDQNHPTHLHWSNARGVRPQSNCETS